MSREPFAPGAVIREGRALIAIPDPSQAYTGSMLEPAWLPVFYNPRMEFNRDVSVVALRAYIALGLAPTGEACVAEPLTATGVRSVRYALEVPGVSCVVAGDIDEAAARYASFNAGLNGVDGVVQVMRGDAREILLASKRERGLPFHVVDLDPFGSPAPFIEAAAASIGHRGLLAMTATDLAVLEGSKRKAAARRYMVRVEKAPESKEIGLRVLVGYAARILAAYDKAVRPLMAYYADHYYRVFLLVERGARRADRVLEECLGYSAYCRGDKRTYLDSTVCPDPEPPSIIGPLWRCSLNNEDFTREVARLARTEYSYLSTSDRILDLAETLTQEAPLEEGRLHVRVEQAASYARASMPRVARLLDTLESMGYRAVRSHYGPTSIRTDAPYRIVAAAIQALASPS